MGDPTGEALEAGIAVEAKMGQYEDRWGPFAHTPSQCGWLPSQATWHGGAAHSNEHAAPSRHVQVPFAHSPVQSLSSRQSR